MGGYWPGEVGGRQIGRKGVLCDWIGCILGFLCFAQSWKQEQTLGKLSLTNVFLAI